MSDTKPSILIVPGSFTPAKVYHGLVVSLKGLGFDSHVYDLPSASRKPPQRAATLAEDVMFFNGVLHAMCHAGKDIVVIGHSYGGSVVTECGRGLTQKSESRGRVLGLIYMTALVPKPGEYIGAIVAHIDQTNLSEPDGDYLYMSSAEKAIPVVLQDVDTTKAREIYEITTYHSSLSFGSQCEYAGYEHVDHLAYIRCEEDKCFPVEFQNQMIERLAVNGKAAEVYPIACGHFPTAAKPEELVQVIRTAVGKMCR